MLQRFAFAGLCLATVAASAAAVLTLERYGVFKIAPVSDDRVAERSAEAVSNIARREDLQTSKDTGPLADGHDDAAPQPAVNAPPAVQQPHHEAEIAFVPRHVLPLLPTLAEVPDDDAAAQVSAWSLDAWTTETQRNAAAPAPASGPRLSVKAAVQLPWQTAAPAASSRTVSLKERLAEISPTASKRLVTKFLAANAIWPPADIGLVAIKDKKVIELHARSEGGEWKLVHQYPVRAASGAAGPKLRQGDRQVPEGVYAISFLNPNSRYHVALRVDYPNAFDRRMAEKDGRKDLGGDIMIHGKAVSIGCLAIGDEAAEELFVLAEMTGLANVKLVIAPTDFRSYGVPEVAADKPKWLPELYGQVASAMSEFKAPPSIGLLSFFGKW